MIAAYSYLAIVVEAGTRSVAIAEASRHGLASILRPYLILRVLLALAGIALSLPIVYWLFENHLLSAALIMASCLAVPFLTDGWLIAAGRYELAAGVTTLRWLVYMALLGLLAAMDHFTLPALCLCFFLSWAFAALLSWLPMLTTKYPSPRLRGEVRRGATHTKHSLLRQGLPVLGAALVMQALQNADLLTIGATLGAEAAGYYYLAAAIFTAGLVFANAAGNVALSRYASFRDHPQSFRHRLGKDLLALNAIALTGVILLILLAPPLLPLLFGAEYQPAVPVLLALLPCFLLYHLTTVYYQAGIAAGFQHQHWKAFLITFICLPFALFLAWHLNTLIAFAAAKGVIQAVLLMALYATTPSSFRPSLSRTLLLPVFLASAMAALLWQGAN